MHWFQVYSLFIYLSIISLIFDSISAQIRISGFFIFQGPNRLIQLEIALVYLVHRHMASVPYLAHIFLLALKIEQ